MDKYRWALQHLETMEKVEISQPIFTVGRSCFANLSTKDASISRNHGQLLVTADGSLFVQDLKSCNGIFVNDEKVTPMEMKLLNTGDEIGFGLSSKFKDNPRCANSNLIYKVIKEKNYQTAAIIEIEDESELNSIEEQIVPKAEAEINCDNLLVTNKEKDENPSTSKDADNVNSPTTEIPEKEIVETKKPDNLLQFSINESYDCVVISDDDEDENSFACSQLFQLNERIKKEKQYVDEDLDQFLHIKRELEDLDFNEDNLLNKVPIEVEEPFNDTMDLLHQLESQKSTSSHESPTIEKRTHLDENFDSSDVFEQLIERSDDIIENLTKTDRNPPIINEQENKNDESNTSKTIKPPNLNLKKSYVKPPVVAAHVQAKAKPKPKEPPKKAEKVGKPTKRKNPEKPQTTPKKLKTGCNFVESKSDSKSINQEFKKRHPKQKDTRSNSLDKDNLVKLVEERRRKLREITEKNKKTSVEKPKVKAVAKIKSSEGRGQFLLDNNPGPSSKMPKTSNPPVKAAISEILLPKKVPKPPSKNNNAIRDERVGIMWKNNCLVGKEKPPQKQANVNIDDIIGKIVHWPARWLEEQKTISKCPPVNDHNPVKMLRFFNSFSDYQQIVTPLIILELWQYVFEALYKEANKNPFRAHITHSRVVDKMLYIYCECYIPLEEVKKNNIPRGNDFALNELKFIDNDKNRYQNTGLSVITVCTKTTMTKDTLINREIAQLSGAVPHTRVNFTLVTHNSPDKRLYTKVIVCKLITNIGYFFQLFKTVKLLGMSPISKLVLKPVMEDYKVDASKRKLILRSNLILNEQQKIIVLEAAEVCLKNKPGLYLIKGPPGTGKTTVIVNLILQMLLTNQKNTNVRILLTAPSNAAVDSLILKIIEARHTLSESDGKILKLIRLGPDSSVSRNVQKYTLNGLSICNVLRNYENTKEYKEAMVQKNFDQDLFLRKLLGHKYNYEIKTSEDHLLLNSNIICTTLNSSLNYRLLNATNRGHIKFSSCIIDEATQCTEIECLSPIQLGIDTFVLVGDPQQLPATVYNLEAKILGYGKSLFSRISENLNSSNSPNNSVRMLREQYRMDKEICQFPNKQFYNGELKSVINHSNKIIPRIKPYLLFNIFDSLNGTPQNEDNEYFNTDEVAFVHRLLVLLTSTINNTCKYSIGVITPYTNQRDKIRSNISSIKFNSNVTITVNTVDSFQGQENDIVIISCVRCNANIFVQNSNRLNVALTRARQALYIIGNYALFKQSKTLFDLREDCKLRHLCVDIKEVSKNYHLHSIMLKKLIFDK